VNSSGEIVVQSSGLPTRPFIRPKGKDTFWTTGIFRWDLFGSGAGVDITVTPELTETSNPSAIPFTTAYYFPSTDAPPTDHSLTIPLQTVHYTIIPDTTSPHTETTTASQAPIDTSLSPRFTPTLPPRYHVLNASIPTPTQITSGTPGFSTPSGHHLVLGFIPTLPRPPFRGPLPFSIGGTDPSGTIPSFTPNYQISIIGQFHQGGQTQSPFAGQLPIRTQPLIVGKPPPTHPMEKTYLHPWPSIGIILFNIILTRLGGNSLKIAPTYPLVHANLIQVRLILFGARMLNPTPLFKGTTL
jgi:hypothetical protein